jgi:hypothetical protein
MRVAFILIVLVLAVMVAGLLRLRRSAKTGMPPPEVLERASRRARELEAEEKREENQ